MTVVIGFSTFWIVKNRKAFAAFFSGTEVTTAAELQDEREQNKNTIDDLLKKVADRDKKISELNAQVTELLASIEATENLIDELVEDYVRQISALTYKAGILG